MLRYFDALVVGMSKVAAKTQNILYRMFVMLLNF